MLVKKFNKNFFKQLGINCNKIIHYNLSYPDLLKHEIIHKEGKLLDCKYGKTYSITTGKYTGRSPNDRWIVKNPESESKIWWGKVNQPITSDIYNSLYTKAIDHVNSLDKFYLFDGYCGSNPSSQKKIRFIHELAWQQHFVTNMFIRPAVSELVNFEPDFTIINACSAVNDEWEKHNLNSEVAIVFNIEKKIGVILGTWYGGENKKGIFSLMNYWLPNENIMTMHCAANIGPHGDACLFFGLSGTGKTTLSADKNRSLIGDDEHGWDSDGIFNLEGGCYAKTVDLSEENEPSIYKAIKTNALLENVYSENDIPDYTNASITPNGRVSYPIHHIENWNESQIGNHPENIIFLTCDAYGVFPPISKLTPEQTMYHFINGYTSKIAGTERGITEPQATFSACFGEAFLMHHPLFYSRLLKEKIEKHNSNVYLINTGWTGGAYGEGHRISIDYTRKCIDSIFSGEIENVELLEDPLFQLKYPKELSHVPANICQPNMAWENQDEYIQTSHKLYNLFVKNYEQYSMMSKM
jgi:phosphoenolpyruvate carboxykinase (ATP)